MITSTPGGRTCGVGDCTRQGVGGAVLHMKLATGGVDAINIDEDVVFETEKAEPL